MGCRQVVRARPRKVVEASEPAEKPLQPRQCQRYLQRTLAKEFRSIVQGFVSEARNGGCAHMKLAAELLEPATKASTRKKGTAQRLLEKLGE